MASIVSRVYDDMRTRILRGEFGVNSLFVEQSIAEEYEVSRGTAREALQLLCNSKFLIKHPRKGYFIYNISDDELQDILITRFFLEIGSMSIVIDKCTDEQIKGLYDTLKGPKMDILPENTVNSNFHLALAKLSGNETLCEILEGLLDITARKNLTISSEDYEDSHGNIISALLKRDIEEAKKALKIDLRIK